MGLPATADIELDKVNRLAAYLDWVLVETQLRQFAESSSRIGVPTKDVLENAVFQTVFVFPLASERNLG
jgi:hypothetical protein